VTSTTYASPLTSVSVIAGIAAQLSRGGASALPAALLDLDRYVGGTATVVLSRLGGRRWDSLHIGRAAPIPAPSPAPSPAPVSGQRSVELPLRRGARLLGWLRVDGLPPTASTEVLATVADILALVLTATSIGAVDDLLADADLDCERLADELHDGPAQALVAARYATDLAARTLRATPGDAISTRAQQQVADARAAVQEALVGLRQTIWWQRSRCDSDLLLALLALVERQRAAGLAELRIAVVPPGGDLTRGLRPAVVVTAYRLVQALLRPPSGPLTLVLRRGDGLLDLDLRGGRVLDDAAFGRWSRRVDALGGHAMLSHARVRLLLPDDLPRPTGWPA
jgi:Histidine kinase